MLSFTIFLAVSNIITNPTWAGQFMNMPPSTIERLQAHLKVLTHDIGERSVRIPKNLQKTARYIENHHRNLGIPVKIEPYKYHGITVENIVAEFNLGKNPSYHYIIGAHYDSVAGTVGADDNASAIAVQLEVAHRLHFLLDKENLNIHIKFVSFALEEPPAFGTRFMGSRVYAKAAKKASEKIDGMICLEMVGYACHEAGCQGYPFPLMLFDYPDTGNFIGIIGNFGSRKFMRKVLTAFSQNSRLPVVNLTVPFNGWMMPSVRLSDHAPFWDNGFKAVMITDSAFYRNPHYHLASDTMDKLDFQFMAEVVESLLIFCRTHQ